MTKCLVDIFAYIRIFYKCMARKVQNNFLFASQLSVGKKKCLNTIGIVKKTSSGFAFGNFSSLLDGFCNCSTSER